MLSLSSQWREVHLADDICEMFVDALTDYPSAGIFGC